jgi:hypothetical protein
LSRGLAIATLDRRGFAGPYIFAAWHYSPERPKVGLTVEGRFS